MTSMAELPGSSDIELGERSSASPCDVMEMKALEMFKVNEGFDHDINSQNSDVPVSKYNVPSQTTSPVPHQTIVPGQYDDNELGYNSVSFEVNGARSPQEGETCVLSPTGENKGDFDVKFRQAVTGVQSMIPRKARSDAEGLQSEEVHRYYHARSDEEKDEDRPVTAAAITVESTEASQHEADEEKIEICDMNSFIEYFSVKIRRFRSKEHRVKPVHVVIVCTCLFALLVFASLMGVSFEYVGYNEYGLEVSIASGTVKRNRTFYSGCYVLGPDSNLLRFPATARTVSLTDMEIFTSDRLAVKISLTYLYFIRPQELGQLYSTYAFEYADVVEKVAVPAIKNSAVAFSLEDYRLRREGVAARFHTLLQEKIGGNCCRHVCDFAICNLNCSQENCTQGLHIDVKYFFLGELSIPAVVGDIFLRVIGIQVRTETAQLVQQESVIQKHTDFLIAQQDNDAREILMNATACASLIEETALHSADQLIQTAVKEGWHELNSRLNMTQEDHQLSVLFLKTLREIDLRASAGFTDQSGFVDHGS